MCSTISMVRQLSATLVGSQIYWLLSSGVLAEIRQDWIFIRESQQTMDPFGVSRMCFGRPLSTNSDLLLERDVNQSARRGTFVVLPSIDDVESRPVHPNRIYYSLECTSKFHQDWSFRHEPQKPSFTLAFLACTLLHSIPMSSFLPFRWHRAA